VIALCFCEHCRLHFALLANVVHSQFRLFMHRSSTRRIARYRTEIPLIVRVLGQDGYIRVHGRCFEIAEGGLGAVITSEFGAGEMVSLEFTLPTSPELQVVRAVVRHRMGFLHGFEFIGLLPEQRELIKTYCRTLQPA